MSIIMSLPCPVESGTMEAGLPDQLTYVNKVFFHIPIPCKGKTRKTKAEGKTLMESYVHKSFHQKSPGQLNEVQISIE